ncbi:YhcN/YlaJ family sporulation lipoprotein [Paenibacillus cellulositrophicus]|uniref:YhcN/YlaJ family sporulation lipoprotein n=1 Tax=Paenibacillus cellulositrophicus TaxID=562959 RepID=UPI00142EDFF8|nr:YhcN/YlaJ family sporulation lipoprotein [Paenibacillus cellulositrophicus]
MLRSKAISLSVSAALLVSMAGVAGCTTKEPANTNIRTKNVIDGNGRTGRIGVNSLRENGLISPKGYTYNTNSTNNGNAATTHNLTNAQLSQKLSDKVAAMKEVKSANVLVAGDTAYVAVSLRDTASNTGGNTGGNMGAKSFGGTHNMMNGSSFNNAGTANGSSFNNRSKSGTVRNGVRGTAPNAAAAQHNIRNYSSKGASITGNNGYNMTTYGTAGTTDNGVGTYRGMGAGGYSDYRNDTITSDIKDRIANTIKSTDNTIKNVYVSANPGFVQGLSNFAAQTQGGHPIKGLMSDLSTMVERIFPMNAGNGNRTTNYNAPVHHFDTTNR